MVGSNFGGWTWVCFPCETENDGEAQKRSELIKQKQSSLCMDVQIDGKNFVHFVDIARRVLVPSTNLRRPNAPASKHIPPSPTSDNSFDPQ